MNIDSKLNNQLIFNEKCYKFKKIIFKENLFTIDATYVIHLNKNGRFNNIINQLKEFKPTNIVYILFNKGYKNCKKTNNIKYPAHDLIDCFFQIFKHSKNKNYNNILILEDDFIFDKNKISNKNHIFNINNFLEKKINSNFTYYLGCVPWLISPIDFKFLHFRNFGSTGTHSVVYSKIFREYLLNNYSKIKHIKDWDVLIYMFSKNKYVYHTPLCYQLFPDTENSKTSGNFNLIFNYLRHIPKIIFKILNLHNSIEPGYSILYTFSKVLFFFILILFYFTLRKVKVALICKNGFGPAGLS
jgi:hypothetical protein